jgi:hypothetical protein
MYQTYEGYWNDGRVLTAGSPIRIANRCRVLITVLEEQEQEPKVLSLEDKLARLAEIDRMAADSADENLRIEDFPKVKFGREPIIFTDEE